MSARTENDSSPAICLSETCVPVPFLLYSILLTICHPDWTRCRRGRATKAFRLLREDPISQDTLLRRCGYDSQTTTSKLPPEHESSSIRHHNFQVKASQAKGVQVGGYSRRMPTQSKSYFATMSTATFHLSRLLFLYLIFLKSGKK